MPHIPLVQWAPRSGAFATLFIAATLSAGCMDEDRNPCDRYVSYMCDCHGDDHDCADLEATYEDADQDLQDSCATELDDQQAEDDTSEHVCTAGGDTGA
jgi:hypothetical protein